MRDTAAYTWIEKLLYSTVGGSRFTQRSSIMPDAWIRFGLEGPAAQDLLLVANWRGPGMELADRLAARLCAGCSAEQCERVLAEVQLAPAQGVVVARLTFAQLVRAAMPLSPWFQRYLLREGEPSSYFASPQAFLPLRAALRGPLEQSKVCLLRRPGRNPPPPVASPHDAAAQRDARSDLPRITDDLVWLTRVAGGLALLHELAPQGLEVCDEAALAQWDERLRDPEALLDALFKLLCGIAPPAGQEPLWSVHRNRGVELAIRESTATVKADVARHVFDIAGRGVRWAVIDTGIDATHIAFRRRTDQGVPYPHWLALTPQMKESFPHAPRLLTRVVATYDFTQLRALMAVSAQNPERHLSKLPPKLQRKLQDPQLLGAWKTALQRTRGQFRPLQGRDELVPNGRAVDWDVWEPLLQVAHKEPDYEVPLHRHGTHVAGILAADWRPQDRADDPVREELGTPRRLVERTGMCPEIELYDLRVMNEDGTADEFAVLAAMQFVRALNARHEHLEIHGVNLSLSLLHEVSNFACGATPVCEECERLVGSGVTVVAAAGNYGRAQYMTTDRKVDEGYRTASITDPGNAPSVITVGATHRAEPHTYGVSYFSSRGPTGDGRAKPDLVAPGEKIISTVPGDSEDSLDGTSMAAPHVSGAAALLMCRYPELKGKPAEVKRILCSTAKDLGRDRYFQGAGLLDALAALESF